LGQILFYQEGDTREKLDVYLFGECIYDKEKVAQIVKVFSKYGVTLYEFYGVNDSTRKVGY